jgi:hypothetical protein
MILARMDYWSIATHPWHGFEIGVDSAQDEIIIIESF